MWLILWGASLMLPVAITGHTQNDVWLGHEILTIGWLGMLQGQFGWFANIAFFLVLLLPILSRRGATSAYVSSACLAVLAADALLWHDIYLDSGVKLIQSFGAGYYAWLAAMFGAAGSLVFWTFGGRNGRGRG